MCLRFYVFYYSNTGRDISNNKKRTEQKKTNNTPTQKKKDMEATKPFQHKNMSTPFWFLQINENTTICVTAACLSPHLRVCNKTWRAPRSTEFRRNVADPNNRCVFQTTNKFQKGVAKSLRDTLKTIPCFQFNTAILSIEAFHLILKCQKREPSLRNAFSKYAENATLACAQRDGATKTRNAAAFETQVTQMCENAASQGGFFKTFSNNHPSIKATRLFLKEACAVNANQIASETALWKNVLHLSP